MLEYEEATQQAITALKGAASVIQSLHQFFDRAADAVRAMANTRA